MDIDDIVLGMVKSDAKLKARLSGMIADAIDSIDIVEIRDAIQGALVESIGEIIAQSSTIQVMLEKSVEQDIAEKLK